MYGPVPNDLRLNGASRDAVPTYCSSVCFGRIWPPAPTNGTYQPPVGCLKVRRTVVGVDCLNFVEVDVQPQGSCRGLRVGDVLVGEDNIVRGEWLAVSPLDARLELVRGGLAVGAQSAVVLAGDLGSQDGRELAVAADRHERLATEAPGDGVLGALRQVRIEDGRALPHQDAQRAAASASPCRRGRGGRLARRAGRRSRRRRRRRGCAGSWRADRRRR